MKKGTKTPYAFTIVELLVVIVVIGILAALIVVSYIGINQKAMASSLKIDLSNNIRQLELYKVDHGEYPTGFNESNCPTGTTLPSPDTKYCLKFSPGNTFNHDTDFILAPLTLIGHTNNNQIHYSIIPGGNPEIYTPPQDTTLILYSSPNSDGATYTYGQTSNWVNIRALASANLVWRNTETMPISSQTDGGVGRYIWRAHWVFDTSTIPSGATIISATLSLYIQSIDSASSEHQFHLVSSTQSSTTDLIASDYSAIGTTSIGDSPTFNNLSAGARFNIALTDLTKVTKAGYTKLAARTNHDLSNTLPSVPNDNGLLIQLYQSDYSGNQATYHPRLTVVYR